MSAFFGFFRSGLWAHIGIRLALVALVLALAGCATFLMKDPDAAEKKEEKASGATSASPETTQEKPETGPDETADADEASEEEEAASADADDEPALPSDTIRTADGKLTKFYRVRHIPTDELLRLINLRFYPEQASKAKGNPPVPVEHERVQAHESLNMLIVNEEKQTLAEIVQYLEMVDRLTSQIEITIRVIELSERYEFEYGFDFFLDRATASNSALRSVGAVYQPQSFIDSVLSGSQFQGTTLEFGSVGSVVTELGDLTLFMHALERKGIANIIAEPTIKIHSGETAEINAITREPIQELEQFGSNTTRVTTRYEDVGVKLRVTVKNIGQEAALIEVSPEVSTVVSFTDPQLTGGVSVPVIAQRNAKTVLDVKDGDKIVIGGLKDTRRLVDNTSVPILSSIPIIGNLFKSRREREQKIELIFLIEVHILGEQAKYALQIPGKK